MPPPSASSKEEHDRAGYTTTIFVLDISNSMSAEVEDMSAHDFDPGNSDRKKRMVVKLDQMKELVGRVLGEVLPYNRKTEKAAVVLCGGRTENMVDSGGTPGYEHISVPIPISMASSSMLEKVVALDVAKKGDEGDLISALTIATQLIEDNAESKRKTWVKNFIVITDGEIEMDENIDYVKGEIERLGGRLKIFGFGFRDKEWEERIGRVKESKTVVKKASETIWKNLVEELSLSKECRALFQNTSNALGQLRLPQIKNSKSNLESLTFRIGSIDVNPSEAVVVNVRVAKTIVVARPPKMAKVALLDQRARNSNIPSASGEGLSHMTHQYMEDSMHEPVGLAGPVSEAGKALFNGLYAGTDIKMEDFENGAARILGESGTKGDGDTSESQQPGRSIFESQNQLQTEKMLSGPLKPYTTYRTHASISAAEAGEQGQYLERDQLVKGYSYGSSYIPTVEGALSKLPVKQGIDVLRFIQLHQMQRHYLMGEVNTIYPDPEFSKSQIQLSSFIQAMRNKGLVALLRMVKKSTVELCVAYPAFDEGREVLNYCRVPYGDDVKDLYFPSLTTIKNIRGEPINKHANLPTDEQLNAMDKWVETMDLNHLGDVDMSSDERQRMPWFNPYNSYNPAIHRMKEALFHSVTNTRSLDDNPVAPVLPELVKYLEPSREALDASIERKNYLKEAMAVKEAPPKVFKRKAEDEGTRPDERIDMDELMGISPSKAKASGSSPLNNEIRTLANKKFRFAEETEDDYDDKTDDGIEDKTKERFVKPGVSADPDATDDDATEDEDNDYKKPPVVIKKSSPAPNFKGDVPMAAPAGKVVIEKFGLRDPLGDFEKAIKLKNFETGMDYLGDALDALGEAIKSLVDTSFSHSRYDIAMKCLRKMRRISLQEDESARYNNFLHSFKKYLQESALKKTDFWNENLVGSSVGLITKEEDESHEGSSEIEVDEAAADKFLNVI